MKKYILLSAVILLSIASPLTARRSRFGDLFDDLRQSMEQMHQEVSEAMQEMSHASSMMYNTLSTRGSGSALNIEEKKDSAVIAISGLEKPDNIQAEFDEKKNALTVTTPNATIAIGARGTYVSVGMQTQVKETVKTETKKDDGDKDDTSAATSEYVAYSSAQTGQTVSRPMELTNATVEYDEQQKMLTITVPLEKQRTKKVPVTIK